LVDGREVASEAAFGLFWEAFPPGRKKGRGGAADVFIAIATGNHANRRATPQAMVDGARRYAASHPDPKYVPLPKTWLNDGRWDDDVTGSDADAAQAQQDLEDAIAQVRAEEEAAACRR
jgi:hypothetical protein